MSRVEALTEQLALSLGAAGAEGKGWEASLEAIALAGFEPYPAPASLRGDVPPSGTLLDASKWSHASASSSCLALIQSRCRGRCSRGRVKHLARDACLGLCSLCRGI